MSEWITHRRPTYDDAKTVYPHHYVWVTGEDGIVLQIAYEIVGDCPWMPITPPKPYVKPKSWTVRKCNLGGYDVHSDTGLRVAMNIPTREAAIRIAAIYQKVMP